ncbi:MAG: hypothetical protein ACNI3A_16915 [Desulfovibrio sp.]|uniref:hypothetical protein n=1 Tax=Desulfovibrio sp. 7SRBS1 TaxID=3378064 RepID=UPI003B3EA984
MRQGTPRKGSARAEGKKVKADLPCINHVVISRFCNHVSPFPQTSQVPKELFNAIFELCH